MDEDGVDLKSKTKPNTSGDPDDLAKYNLDNYDDEDTGSGENLPHCAQGELTVILASGIFSNIKGLTYYRSNDEDPYITLKEVCNSICLVFSY